MDENLMLSSSNEIIPNETNAIVVNNIQYPWIACKSKKTGRQYYYNVITKDSVWNLSKEMLSNSNRQQILQEPKEIPAANANPLQNDTEGLNINCQNMLNKQIIRNDFIPPSYPLPYYNQTNNIAVPTTLNLGQTSVPLSARFKVLNEINVSEPVQNNVNINFNEHVDHAPNENDTTKGYGPYKDLRQLLIVRRRRRSLSNAEVTVEQYSRPDTPEENYTQELQMEPSTNVVEEMSPVEEKNNCSADDSNSSDDEYWLCEDTLNEGIPKIAITALRNVARVQTNESWYLVADTNVFLSNLTFLKILVKSDIQCRLLVPEVVLTELQRMLQCQENYLNVFARSACMYLNQLIAMGRASTDKQIWRTLQGDVNCPVGDDRILQCCLKLIENSFCVIFVSNDEILIQKVKASSIIAFTVKQTKELLSRYKRGFEMNNTEEPIVVSINAKEQVNPVNVVKCYKTIVNDLYTESAVKTNAIEHNSITVTKDLYPKSVELYKPIQLFQKNETKTHTLEHSSVSRIIENTSNVRETAVCDAEVQTEIDIHQTIFTNKEKNVGYMNNQNEVNQATFSNKDKNKHNKLNKIIVTDKAVAKNAAPCPTKPIIKRRIITLPKDKGQQPSTTMMPNKRPFKWRRRRRIENVDQTPITSLKHDNTFQLSNNGTKAVISMNIASHYSNTGTETTGSPEVNYINMPCHDSNSGTDTFGSVDVNNIPSQDSNTDMDTRNFHNVYIPSHDSNTGTVTSGSIHVNNSDRSIGNTFNNHTKLSQPSVTVDESFSDTDIISNSRSSVCSDNLCSLKFERGKAGNTEQCTVTKNRCFDVQDASVIENLKMSMEDWISQFVQIMEEVLTQVLQLRAIDPEMPPPWTIHEATECIKNNYYNNIKIWKSADNLSQVLYSLSEIKTGKFRVGMSPTDFIEMFHCGKNLVQELEAHLPNCEDVQAASRLLLKLADDIRNRKTFEDDSVLNDTKNNSTDISNDYTSSRNTCDINKDENAKSIEQKNCGSTKEVRAILPQTVKLIRKLDIDPHFSQSSNAAKLSQNKTGDVKEIISPNKVLCSVNVCDKAGRVREEEKRLKNIVNSKLIENVMVVTENNVDKHLKDIIDQENNKELTHPVGNNTDDEKKSCDIVDSDSQLKEAEELAANFLPKIKHIFLEAKRFCDDIHSEFSKNHKKTSARRKLQMQKKADEHTTLLTNMLNTIEKYLNSELVDRALDLVAKDKAPLNQDFQAVRERHETIYRGILTKCMEQGTILLEAMDTIKNKLLKNI